MAITDGSFSFLTETLSTFTPPPNLLTIGEPYCNSADGTLWVGATDGSAIEIGLNAKSGLVSSTGKYLVRDASEPTVNIPYDPESLGIAEYFEFYILFNVSGGDNPVPLYSQPIDWGNISDPINSLLSGSTLLAKFFAYGYSAAWSAIPIWTDDSATTIFGGNVDAKFYYTQIQAPNGLLVPQRSILRFQPTSGVTILDDVGNDTTIVEVGQSLVTRITTGVTTLSLDFNYSRYYVLANVTDVNLPGGASPTEPFELTIKNIDAVNPITINQGTYPTLAIGETVLILFDGTEYHHWIF